MNATQPFDLPAFAHELVANAVRPGQALQVQADPITVARESLALLSMAVDTLSEAAWEIERTHGTNHAAALRCRELMKRIGVQCEKWQGGDA